MGRVEHSSSLPLSFLLKFLRTCWSQGNHRRLLLQITFILSVVTAIINYRRSKRLALKPKGTVTDVRRLPLPPGPWGWPIVGILPSLAGGNPQQVIADMSKTYGPVISFRLGTHLVVILNDFDSIKEAFVKSADRFSDRPKLTMFEEVHKGGGGAGVVLAKYHANWKNLRRFAMKTFRTLGMGRSAIEEKIAEEAMFVAQGFMEQRGQPFRTNTLTNLAVANTISMLVFNERNDYKDPVFLEVVAKMFVLFQQFGVGIVNFLPWTRYLPWSDFKHVKDIPTFFEDNWYRPKMEEHLKTLNANKIRDFLDAFLIDYYLQEDSPYANDEKAVMGAIGNMFGAGLDTTAVMLDWNILMITKHPDVQEKMRKELDEVVGRHRTPRWSDRSNLHYVMATLEEIMRWAAAGPFGVPHSPIEDTEFRGYFIPKDAVIIPNIHAVLRNPDVFPDPTVFKPERFMDFNGKFVKHEHMTQFGLGRRGCIGEQLARIEIFIIVTHTLHRFTLRAPNGDPNSISTDNYLGLSKNPVPYKLCAIPRTDTLDFEIEMDLLSDDNITNNNNNDECKT